MYFFGIHAFKSLLSWRDFLEKENKTNLQIKIAHNNNYKIGHLSVNASFDSWFYLSYHINRKWKNLKTSQTHLRPSGVDLKMSFAWILTALIANWD